MLSAKKTLKQLLVVLQLELQLVPPLLQQTILLAAPWPTLRLQFVGKQNLKHLGAASWVTTFR
jgi:hypothetical protein